LKERFIRIPMCLFAVKRIWQRRNSN